MLQTQPPPPRITAGNQTRKQPLTGPLLERLVKDYIAAEANDLPLNSKGYRSLAQILNPYRIADGLYRHFYKKDHEFLVLAIYVVILSLFARNFLAFVPKRGRQVKNPFKFNLLTRLSKGSNHPYTQRGIRKQLTVIQNTIPGFEANSLIRVSLDTLEPLLSPAICNGWDIALRSELTDSVTTYTVSDLRSIYYRYQISKRPKRGFREYFSYYRRHYQGSCADKVVSSINKQRKTSIDRSHPLAALTTDEKTTLARLRESHPDLALWKHIDEDPKLKRKKRGHGDGHAKNRCSTTDEKEFNIMVKDFIACAYRERGLRAPCHGNLTGNRPLNHIVIPLDQLTHPKRIKSLKKHGIIVCYEKVTERDEHGFTREIERFQEETYIDGRGKKSPGVVCIVDRSYFMEVLRHKLDYDIPWTKARPTGETTWFQTFKKITRLRYDFSIMHSQYQKWLKRHPEKRQIRQISNITPDLANEAMARICSRAVHSQPPTEKIQPVAHPALSPADIREIVETSYSGDHQLAALLATGRDISTGLLDILPKLLTPRWLWALLHIQRDYIPKIDTMHWVTRERSNGTIAITQLPIVQIMEIARRDDMSKPTDAEVFDSRKIDMSELSRDEKDVLREAYLEQRHAEERLAAIKKHQFYDPTEGNELPTDEMIEEWLEKNRLENIGDMDIAQFANGLKFGYF